MTMNPVDSLQACMRQEDALITEFSAILEEETEVLVGPATSARCKPLPNASRAWHSSWLT